MSDRRRSSGLWAALVILLALGVGLLPVRGTRASDDLVPHRLRIALSTGTRNVTLWLAPGFDIGVAATPGIDFE